MVFGKINNAHFRLFNYNYNYEYNFYIHLLLPLLLPLHDGVGVYSCHGYMHDGYIYARST